MSELLTSFGAADDDAGVVEAATAGRTSERSAGATVLITAQQVLFATAAARPWAPAKTSRPRRNYPARNDFLESSRMAREMYRL